MRIISGSARGRRLSTPEGEQTRPTSSVVKEAMFSIIQFDIEGGRILDLFAGSGQLGIEALSRGADSAVFVDCRRESINIIESNLETVDFSEKAQVICSDFVPFVRSCEKNEFDIILLDPPYGGDLLNSALEQIIKFDILSRTGIIMCESARDDKIKISDERYMIRKHYYYGKRKLTPVVRSAAE